MRTLLCLLCLLLAAGAPPARAEPDELLPEGVRRVALIEGWRQEDGTHVAAIEIALAPGWRTYWRVPGRSGIPPNFDWSGSRNLAAIAYEWPRPRVFDTGGTSYYGYEDALILPVRLTAQDPGAPIEAALDLGFGICSDICVPAALRVDARLRPDTPARGRSRIDAALAERALTPGEAGIVAARCSLLPRGDGFAITASIDLAAPPPPGTEAVIESPGLHVDLPELRIEGSRITASASVAGAAASPWLDRDGLRITLLEPDRAIDIRGCRPEG